jgi:hypothetical protein
LGRPVQFKNYIGLEKIGPPVVGALGKPTFMPRHHHEEHIVENKLRDIVEVLTQLPQAQAQASLF